jgi:phosphohistidine phosphatase
MAGKKRLYLLRHAKSSWDDPALDDFARPLNKRGQRDAPFMGRRFREQSFAPDRIVSSPAERAYETARTIARELGHALGDIVRDDELYPPARYRAGAARRARQRHAGRTIPGSPTS